MRLFVCTLSSRSRLVIESLIKNASDQYTAKSEHLKNSWNESHSNETSRLNNDCVRTCSVHLKFYASYYMCKPIIKINVLYLYILAI